LIVGFLAPLLRLTISWASSGI